MIIMPRTLDAECRSEFWRYCGETFQMCIKAGCTAQEARQFAIDFTNEKIKGYGQQIQN